jgi:hypothetical protein
VCAAAIAAAAVASSSCARDLTRSSHSPTQLVIMQLLTASTTTGATPTTFNSGPLGSDIPGPGEGYFNDFGQATIRAQLRDLGAAGSPAVPTQVNDVTITRYRVVYRRSDGRNTPGQDVPHPIDGAVTLTVPGGGTGIIVFEIVRHNAKIEPPLAALGTNPQVLTTIAEVTFFGRDQAGNEISTTGNVQINFASFAG